ncbi:Neuropeptide SIFamide [Eumeta japonica]|uniref:Neuropeptide SIFamide n=1 Tax=Eumeta variegata TaxID=151549 RepID=A0A4C1W3T5_EUMVA|nr:Neuropeptide SIFamide [Eumeta japonica]
MINAFHDNSTYMGKSGGQERENPICARDYNSTMGGIDLKDEKLSKVPNKKKKGVKRYIKMFKRLLNGSVYNAYVLIDDRQIKRINETIYMTHREARYHIAKSQTKRHSSPAPVYSLTLQPQLRLDRTQQNLPIRERRSRSPCPRSWVYNLLSFWAEHHSTLGFREGCKLNENSPHFKMAGPDVMRLTIGVVFVFAVLLSLAEFTEANYKNAPMNGIMFGKRGPSDYDPRSKTFTVLCEIANEACQTWFPSQENK